MNTRTDPVQPAPAEPTQKWGPVEDLTITIKGGGSLNLKGGIYLEDPGSILIYTADEVPPQIADYLAEGIWRVSFTEKEARSSLRMICSRLDSGRLRFHVPRAEAIVVTDPKTSEVVGVANSGLWCLSEDGTEIVVRSTHRHPWNVREGEFYTVSFAQETSRGGLDGGRYRSKSITATYSEQRRALTSTVRWLAEPFGIAADDFIWSVACSVQDLVMLLEDPYRWVSVLSTQVDESVITLAAHFTIQMVHSLVEPTDAGRREIIQVSGVSDTGILRVVVNDDAVSGAKAHFMRQQRLRGGPSQTVDGAALDNRSDADLAEDYWSYMVDYVNNHAGGKPCFLYHGDNRSVFAHICVWNASKQPHEYGGSRGRGLWVASYLVARMGPEYADRFLDRLDWRPAGDAQGDGLASSPFWALGSPKIDAAGASFTYMGTADSDDQVCDIQWGTVPGGSASDEPPVVLMNAVVKDYKAPPPTN